MNPQGQAGAPGQQQRPGQPQQARAQNLMYTAEQIESLQYVTDEEKSKYKTGLAGLWAKVSNVQPESAESQQARRKIVEFSRMLLGKINQRMQQQQQQAQQQPQQQQQQQVQQPQQQPQATQASPVQPHAPAQPAQMQQRQASQTQGQAQPNVANSTGAQSAPNNTQNQGGQQAKPQLPQHILQHLAGVSLRAPPNIVKDKTPAEVQKWIDDAKERYGRALNQMEQSKKHLANLEKHVKDRTDGGNPLSDQEMANVNARKEQQRRLHGEAKTFVDNFRKQLTGNPAPGTAAQRPAGQQQPVQQANNAQNVTAPVNAAMEAAKQQQQQGARTTQVHPPQTPVHPPQRPGPSIQQPANTQQQPKQELPQQATSMNGAQPVSAPAPQVRAATQPVPPTGPAAGQGRALTHSAALSLANSRASNTPGSAQAQGPQQQQQQQPQPQSGGAGTPGSAGPQVPNAMAAQQGHPHAHPGTQQQPTIQSKMPIPKQLPERAMSVPQGVTVGGGVAAGRPTMSQGSGTLGGVMNQPAVARVQAYNHEAEGDHVLSKKKLDELVRQVCGGTAEGQEGNMLTPDVEESVLSMADSFVDNVLHAACRNAKERGSKVLEIRDIQLVLERTYNIRVPGYSSDELRTVRKVQPAAGWISKMSAVQAAKVMPGKGE
ncbi:transcription initiation factor TFIID subunit A domain-containing protein [Sarocladium implicatum]|nr:transcription initiation factor TFIID subunit A domain-containing protein [Sarocladium implicatum]